MLVIDEFIPTAAIERLGKPDLRWRFDVNIGIAGGIVELS